MVQSRRCVDFKITVYYYIVIFWTIQLLSAKAAAATTTTIYPLVSTKQQSNRSLLLYIQNSPTRVRQQQQQQQQQQKLYQQSITKHKQHEHEQQQDLSFETTSTSTMSHSTNRRNYKSIPIQQQQHISLFNHQMLTDVLRHVVYTFILVVMVTTLSLSSINVSSVYALDMEAFAAQQLLDSSSSSSPTTTSRSSTSTSTATSGSNNSIKTSTTNSNNDDTITTTTTTMSTDEALCRFSQPGLIKGDACVRAGISIENKKDPKNGVNAYGQINRGSYTKCYKEYTLVNTGTNANNEKPYWQSEWMCQ